MLELGDIGETTAKAVINYFEEKHIVEMIEKLASVGLQFKLSDNELFNSTDKLKGLSFVVSGIFSKFSRDDLKKTIEQHGGKNIGSISSKTNYLIAGENMGAEKKKKADKLGVSIISEDDFITMIN